MKKVLLVVALLLLATPVFAVDVTVTATTGAISNPSEPNKLVPLTIGWSGAATADAIRAFALVLNADSGSTLTNIRDFNKGESTKPNGGYGIFPARFRQYITVQNGTDVCTPAGPGYGSEANYNPLSWYSDPNAGGAGNDNVNMVVELGTLFKDSNAPGTSGTLFTVDVNSEGKSECNVCITLDQIRGGVVKKDTTAADVCLPACVNVKFITCTTPSNQVGNGKAAAEAAWGTEGFTNLQGTAVTSCPADVILTNDQNCIAKSDPLKYTYSVARIEPNVIGMTRANAVSTLAAAGFTVLDNDVNGPPTAAITTVGNITAQNPAPGTSCGATTVQLTKVVYPIKTMTATASLYVNWVTVSKPACWAYPRQCRGDADGKKSGLYWVANNDFTILKAAINKAQTAVPPGGFCADFDHKKSGLYWVSSNDLAILKTYINKGETAVPMCGSVTAVPSADVNYWYWCVPTGVTCPTGQICAPAGICPNTP